MRHLLCWLLLAACAEERAMVIVHPDGRVDRVEDCNVGCAAPTLDETTELTEAQYLEALTQMAAAPIGASTLGLDTLLFYAHDTEAMLSRLGTGDLPRDHRRWLEQELSRQTVEIAFRLIGSDGAVLGSLDTQVPLKIKRHLVLQGTGALKRVEVSGKTKRVGLSHLWSRW